jgi:protein ECT2
MNRNEDVEETMMEKIHSTLRKRICLVGPVAENQEAVDAAKIFNVPVLTSETGKELIADETWTTYFILKVFEGPIFDDIYKAEVKHK